MGCLRRKHRSKPDSTSYVLPWSRPPPLPRMVTGAEACVGSPRSSAETQKYLLKKSRLYLEAPYLPLASIIASRIDSHNLSKLRSVGAQSRAALDLSVTASLFFVIVKQSANRFCSSYRRENYHIVAQIQYIVSCLYIVLCPSRFRLP